MKHRYRVILGCFVFVVASNASLGWWGAGHERVTRFAVTLLPNDFPAFFITGVDTIAHCSRDPDLFTRPIAPPELHAQQAPEHYMDLELLVGETIPPTRYEFIQLCRKKDLSPENVGLLPYAVIEWTQRLAVAFAEYRKSPENPHIQQKTLVYAGMLSHYAQDICQPLHTTIHWDGRANPDGTSPRSGIHKKVDALLEKLELSSESPTIPPGPAAFDDLSGSVLAELRRSNTLVDRIYELENELPDTPAPVSTASPVMDFGMERFQGAGIFTAHLYLTAWKNSEKIDLPDWAMRPETDGAARKRDCRTPLLLVGFLGVFAAGFIAGWIIRRMRKAQSLSDDN